jgi:UDP:flavonoid glycosyltransferase YjiC (YdhE family)
MHITIFVYGTWGDIRPHVVLGTALRQNGHNVQVVASPGYENWVRARHLDFYPLTTDINSFARENASLMDAGIVSQLRTLRTHIAPILEQMGLEVLEATRHSDVLITVEFGAALLFDVLKANRLRTILINPAPLNPTREFSSALPPAPPWLPFRDWYNLRTYDLLHRIQWSTFASARNAIAQKHLGIGKTPFRAYTSRLTNTPAVTTVSRHVVPRPADWLPHWQITGYLFDDDPEWSPPQSLIDYLEAGEAPVYIGFGSMPDSRPEATTRLIIEAVQKAGKRAVLLSGWAGLGMKEPPDFVYVLKYAPHSWLFPKMAAVVHHGGAGTTASAFRAGVPMVVIPHNGDQPFWGRVASQLGVGSKPIPRKRLTSERLAAAVQDVCENTGLKTRASQLASQIEVEEGLQKTIETVESFLK